MNPRLCYRPFLFLGLALLLGALCPTFPELAMVFPVTTGFNSILPAACKSEWDSLCYSDNTTRLTRISPPLASSTEGLAKRPNRATFEFAGSSRYASALQSDVYNVGMLAATVDTQRFASDVLSSQHRSKASDSQEHGPQDGHLNIRDFGATGDGVVDDTSAIQRAVLAVPRRGIIIFPPGIYKVTRTIYLKPELTLLGLGGTVSVAADITAFLLTGDQWPGSVRFENFSFTGSQRQGTAIRVTGNNPHILIANSQFTSLKIAVSLEGSYNSMITGTRITTVGKVGISIAGDSHATTVANTLVDCGGVPGSVGLAINHNMNTTMHTPIHNITVEGSALQNCGYGLWAENIYELNLQNLYQEGNAIRDLHLGSGDGGHYLRPAYNTYIAGWQSSSNAAVNIDLQHAVGAILTGLSFNTLPLPTHVRVDRFSDRIFLHYNRLANTGAPFDFQGDAAHRVVVVNNGRFLFPSGMTDAIQFGAHGVPLGRLYQGTVPGTGRNATTLESLNQDMQFRVPEFLRIQNAGGTDTLVVDNLNGGTAIGSGGTLIKKHLSTTAALDFSPASANACSATLTITLEGAAQGDVVALGIPHGSMNNGSMFLGWVSASDKVSVQHCSVGGTRIDPLAGRFRIDVWQH